MQLNSSNSSVRAGPYVYNVYNADIVTYGYHQAVCRSMDLLFTCSNTWLTLDIHLLMKTHLNSNKV